MAKVRRLLREKLECYLNGALTQERLIEILAESDKEFRFKEEDDFMDVDEGNNDKAATTELSQSFLDAIWLHRYKLDEDAEVKTFHAKIQVLIEPLTEQKVITKNQLLSSLELPSLGALGLVN